MRSKYPYVAVALKYATDVVSGQIAAGKWVRLACQRQLDDLAKQKDRAWPYRFDKEAAEKPCRFIELLPHTKGKWARQPIRLSPWQVFIVTTVFGWLKRSDGFRRFRELYLEVPRKNGKSLFAAAVGLYMLTADGEAGAEVYSGATKEKQAWEVFRPARLMAKWTSTFQQFYGVQVNASNLAIESNGAKFEPVIGNPGDGPSPHCHIADEFHEHQTPDQYDSAITGMGARTQPLMLIITTAGKNLAGPCYDKHNQVQKILDKIFENDEIFGIIYGIDKDDNWTDFAVWPKANPNFGISVFEDYLRARWREAIQRASRQNIVRCKHLNEWVNAGIPWMNMVAFRKCADPTLVLEEFRASPGYLALDLASVSDFAVRGRLFERDGHFYAFGAYYLPEDTIANAPNSDYPGWAKDKKLIETSGAVTDLDLIERETLEETKRLSVREIAYDPWQAAQMANHLTEQGLTMVEIRPTVPNFSAPMKQIETLVLSGRWHYDGDPIMEWMFSNVVAFTDAKDNIYPRKERPENKIDIVVALIMAMARAMANPEAEVGFVAA